MRIVVQWVKCKAFASCRFMSCSFFYVVVMLFRLQMYGVFVFRLLSCLTSQAWAMEQPAKNSNTTNVLVHAMSVFISCQFLCGGVKSLFGFVFTVVWPSDSVAPLICCDIMPSLLVRTNGMYYNVFLSERESASNTDSGYFGSKWKIGLAFICDCRFVKQQHEQSMTKLSWQIPK